MPIALQLNLVDVEWSVTTVVIEDRYEISVLLTFSWYKRVIVFRWTSKSRATSDILSLRSPIILDK